MSKLKICSAQFRFYGVNILTEASGIKSELSITIVFFLIMGALHPWGGVHPQKFVPKPIKLYSYFFPKIFHDVFEKILCGPTLTQMGLGQMGSG